MLNIVLQVSANCFLGPYFFWWNSNELSCKRKDDYAFKGMAPMSISDFYSLMQSESTDVIFVETEHLTCRFNARVRGRRLQPLSAAVFHVRAVRSKRLQINIRSNCPDFSKQTYKFKHTQWRRYLIQYTVQALYSVLLPAIFRINIIVWFKSLFNVSIKQTWKWQRCVKVINEVLVSTGIMK